MRHSTSGKWLLIVLLCAGLASDYLARLGLNSIFPILRTDLGISDVELGLLASIFLWTYGILSPLAGFIGDRFSRRTVIIASVTAWSLVIMLGACATRPWHLIAMRGALAAAQVCFMPTAQAFITDFHGVETRSKAIGFFQVGSYAGIFLAGLPVVYVSSRLGWRMTLLLCGLTGLMLAFAMRAGLPRTNSAANPAAHQSERVSLVDAISVLEVPSVLAIMAGFCLVSASYWVMVTFLPLFIYERHSVSMELAAFQATFYSQLSAALTMPLFGAVSDLYSTRDVRNRFSLCAIVSLAGAPALLAVGLGSGSATLILGLMLLGVPIAATDASWMPMLSNVTHARQRATAFGMMNMASCLAGGGAAMIAALTMKTLGLSSVIASLGALFVISCALLFFTGYVLLKKDVVDVRNRENRPELEC